MPGPTGFRPMPGQAQGVPQRPAAPMGGGAGRPPMPAMPQARPAMTAPAGAQGMGQRPAMPTQAQGVRPFKKGGMVTTKKAGKNARRSRKGC